MKLAAYISIVLAILGLPSAVAAPEQCRFIEGRTEREACYQRQETARAARQKAQEAQQAAQPKPYEPMEAEDAQLARAIRGICRGC
jgi:type II secretory pathway pseudopilin PulG